MDTRHVQAFFDISRNSGVVEQALAEHGMSSLVRSLSDILTESSSKPGAPKPQEKALVTIGTEDFSGGLRVESVSRPVDVAGEHFYELPPICRMASNSNMFREVMVGPDAGTNFQDNRENSPVRLVLDPLAALGYFQHIHEPTPEPSKLRGTDQVLVFLPETGMDLSQVEHFFCLLLTDVVEVISTREIYALPYDSEYCEGYILRRGRPIPVIKLGKLFGMAAARRFHDRRSRTRGKRLIVARSGSRWIAFSVNSQVQTLRSPAARFSSNSALPEDAPTIGVFDTEMGNLVVPDLHKILHREP